MSDHKGERECHHKKQKGEQEHAKAEEECAHEHEHGDGDEEWYFSWSNPNLLPFEVRGVHPLLEQHLKEITGGRSKLKILVPLCGRSDDIPWLADLGHSVYGVEYDAEGCEAFFKVQNLEFTSSTLGSGDNKVYKAKDKDITLYQCNFFHLISLEPTVKASFDVIWDRAAIRTTVEVEDPNEGTQAYVDSMLKLIASGGKFGMENTRFDVKKYPEQAGYYGQVSDEMIEKLCAQNWEISKIGVKLLKAGEALEAAYKSMEHEIVVHLLTPK